MKRTYVLGVIVMAGALATAAAQLGAQAPAGRRPVRRALRVSRQRRPAAGGGRGPAAPISAIEKVANNLYIDPEPGRQHGCLHHRQRRGPGRHQEPEQRPGHSRSGEDRHRQADHAHHQHAYARRPHRQQRLLPGDRGDRHAREHRGEHAEDEELRRGDDQAGAARSHVQGQTDAPRRQRRHRSVLLRPRRTPTATPSSCSAICA